MKTPTLRYRQTRDGTWYLEWRVSASAKPVARRKARDTEIELIHRIRALEARLANPSAPRPVADLKLKPYDASRYKPQAAIFTKATVPAQSRPEAASKLECQRAADAPAVGRPPHNGRTR